MTCLGEAPAQVKEADFDSKSVCTLSVVETQQLPGTSLLSPTSLGSPEGFGLLLEAATLFELLPYVKLGLQGKSSKVFFNSATLQLPSSLLVSSTRYNLSGTNVCNCWVWTAEQMPSLFTYITFQTSFGWLLIKWIRHLLADWSI